MTTSEQEEAYQYFEHLREQEQAQEYFYDMQQANEYFRKEAL